MSPSEILGEEMRRAPLKDMSELRSSQSGRNRSVDQHHIFPVFRGADNRYAQFFKDVGIDVHAWTVPLESHRHRSEIHGRGRWNQIWQGWIDEHYAPTDLEEYGSLEVTQRDVYHFASRLMDDFGIYEDALPYRTY